MAGWTKEQIAELTRLWADGLTTSAIGRRLGFTKSAVTGKAHRLHLPPRPSPIRTDARTFTKAKRIAMVRSRPVAEPRPPKPSTPEEVEHWRTERKRKHFEAMGESHRSCTFPLWKHGTRVTHEFCTKKAVHGRPYCVEHCVQTFVLVSPTGKREEQDAPIIQGATA